MLLGLVMAAVLATLLVNAWLDRYKPAIADAFSSTLGLKTSIKGPIHLHWHNGPAVALHTLELTGPAQSVANAERLIFGLELLPLLTGTSRINTITLKNPMLKLVRTPAGILPKPKPDKNKTHEPATLRLSETVYYKISNGSIHLDDVQSQRLWKADGIDISAIMKLSAGSTPWHQRLTISADTKINNISSKKLRVHNIVTNMTAENGQYVIDIKQAYIAGGLGRGTLLVHNSDTGPQHKLKLKITQMDTGQSLQAMGNSIIISGKVDVLAQLQSVGKHAEQIGNSLEGMLELKGNKLVIETLNLDNVLDQYSKTQHFNLVDLGAYFFIGPFGAVATKSYDFAGVYRAGQKGSSEIRQLLSRWQIKSGIARAEDVAFSTRRHRVALKGSINIAANRLDRLSLAIVDRNGCALLSQQLSGSLEKPELKQTGKLKPLIGPVINLLKVPGKLLADGQCDPFYAGEVTHP